MPNHVVDKLMNLNYHISFAESCTGGLAAAALVRIPNASKVFDVSFVTYADHAKMQYLGVKEKTIRQFGVVSEEVAAQMAQGVARQADSEIGVGISGIAGPLGGTKEKPVGTVCFGFFINGTLYKDTMYFGDIGRNEVQDQSVEYVYKRLGELL